MKKILKIAMVIFLMLTPSISFAEENNSSSIIKEETEFNKINNIKTEEETETSMKKRKNENLEHTNNKSIIATESGESNITFNNGYNGFCIDYLKSDAKKGEEFIFKNTSYALNNNDNTSVGNYLKIFFTEHYHSFIINNNHHKTNHVIWAFTDNYESKFEESQKIVSDVLKKANEGLTIPDNGAIKKINSTTEAIFDFAVFLSPTNEQQSFFGYKITYRDIINNITGNTSNNNSTENNTGTNFENNITNQNNTTTENDTITKNEILTKENKLQKNDKEDPKLEKHEKFNPEKTERKIIKNNDKITGNPLHILILTLMLTLTAIISIKKGK